MCRVPVPTIDVVIKTVINIIALRKHGYSVNIPKKYLNWFIFKNHVLLVYIKKSITLVLILKNFPKSYAKKGK